MNRRSFFARLLQGAAFAVTTHYAPRALAPIASVRPSHWNVYRGSESTFIVGDRTVLVKDWKFCVRVANLEHEEVLELLS